MAISNEDALRAVNDYIAARYIPGHQRLADRVAAELTEVVPMSTPLWDSLAKGKSMLHIAVKILEDGTITDLADRIEGGAYSFGCLADTSADALKTKLRQRIIRYPDEQWLILSGNTIAEITPPTTPQVRFRPA